MTESDKRFVKALKAELKSLRKAKDKFPGMEKALINLIKNYDN